MKIKHHTSDTEEVRITTEKFTLVFTRRGFHEATGSRSVSHEDFVATRNALASYPLTKLEKLIINLTLPLYNLKEI